METTRSSFWQFRSFQSRLLFFFLGLLIIVQAAIFFTVNQANLTNARLVIANNLAVGAGVLGRLMEDRREILLETARLLSGDFAFKAAYHTNNTGTIRSATLNHMSRVPSARIMMLVSLDSEVIVDTLRPDRGGQTLEWPELLEAAENDEYGETASIVLVDGLPFQMMVVPLLTPDLEAWILIGFPVDDDFLEDMRSLVLSDISVVRMDTTSKWQTLASSLAGEMGDELASKLQLDNETNGQSLEIDLSNRIYESYVMPLIEQTDLNVVAVIQQPLEEALAPYQRLQVILIVLFLAGLLLSTISSIFIARSVTQPLLRLLQGVLKIDQGEYDHRVQTKSIDEVGQLTEAFNHMASGLAEREQMHNLLGKVVSPAIADELLSKEIELGGEERVVTILFSDVRHFTTLCENRNPQDILTLLNTYLTEVSDVIDRNRGVVDKYIGDAVMALFGAPVQTPEDAPHAVLAALEMCRSLKILNKTFREQGLPELEIGIGVNTGLVVAGNMGSQKRLNYTVIGDSVNLAARLEGLTKQYKTPIIVSEY
ncbi:MAG: adenylate/guanylate cyclase domain-containing protein, partial [Pseudomonadota bacterium]